MGLFLRSLSIVALEMLYFVINSFEFLVYPRNDCSQKNDYNFYILAHTINLKMEGYIVFKKFFTAGLAAVLNTLP